MSRPSANVRLTIDKPFITDYFQRHASGWYPGWSVARVRIKIQRNFLSEFKSLAIKYTVTLRRGAHRRTVIVRGQARATRHPQTASPKKSFLVTTHLWHHGMRQSIPRPLAFVPAANLFLYEDIPGHSVEKIIHPVDYAPKPAHAPGYILRFTPAMARLLAKLHSVRRVAGLPTMTKALEVATTKEHFQLIRQHHPRSLPRLRRLLTRCQAAYPTFRQDLYRQSFRRLTHGDAHAGNFIWDGRRLRLIDFGDSVSHHPLSDIGRLFVQLHFLHHFVHRSSHPKIMDEVRSHFRRFYFRRQPRPREVFAINYFMVLNLIQMMAITSFTTPKNQVDRAMAVFLDGVDYFTKRLETLTY